MKHINSIRIQFFLSSVDNYETYSIIKNLKNSYSTDIFNLNTIIIKASADYIVEPLTNIINCAFENGRFPSCLKFSKIVPIFKKGDINNPSDYRPIALTPI
jgi:hypothetical protein